MTDKIKKVLRKLVEKERKIVKDILENIEKENLKGLNIKKLKGYDDIFRVRKRGIRIIFKKTGKNIFVLSIERRSSKTYKNL